LIVADRDSGLTMWLMMLAALSQGVISWAPIGLKGDSALILFAVADTDFGENH
jgi:hypothetical protein